MLQTYFNKFWNSKSLIQVKSTFLHPIVGRTLILKMEFNVQIENNCDSLCRICPILNIDSEYNSGT